MPKLSKENYISLTRHLRTDYKTQNAIRKEEDTSEVDKDLANQRIRWIKGEILNAKRNLKP